MAEEKKAGTCRRYKERCGKVRHEGAKRGGKGCQDKDEEGRKYMRVREGQSVNYKQQKARMAIDWERKKGSRNENQARS